MPASRLTLPPTMPSAPQPRPARVGLISLGCAKNLVDGEILLGTLLQAGIEITNEAPQADAVIVNTCAFIDSAQEESVDAILESAEVREVRNRGQALIVSGCLPQRFRDELPKLFPEVDAFMGVDQVAHAADIVTQAMARRRERVAQLDPVRSVRSDRSEPQSEVSPRLTHVTHSPRYLPDHTTPRLRLTPRHFAYVKVAEGCNHPCSFCTIPRMRGRHRSRPQADIVAEARALLADGVKELNLISQDTTFYGLDLNPAARRAVASPGRSAAAPVLPAAATPLCTLLRDLNALSGDFWIRLLYTHPAHWTDNLIATIADCPKVARYVDMPLQHIHENMLHRMRRETSPEHIVRLIRRIRDGIPGVALRTTFIVGFPGETEACFKTLLAFIRETKFERLGIFTYSREEGTVAGRMAGQVPEKVKQERRNRAMAEQHKVAREVSASFVGRAIRVLVEGRASDEPLRQASVFSWKHGLIRERERPTRELRGRRHWLVARGEADAPDIDGRVYVRGRLAVGEFARVRVVGHTDYDLIAETA
jgi:ribosomal protein S12 methylthiotransferase